MGHTVIATTYLLATFSASLFGIWLKTKLPESHFSEDSKDSIKVGIGLIATMSALVLGLITASAKDSFDNVDLAIKQSAAQILTLDRMLARYGPETKEIRSSLKHSLHTRVRTIWPEVAEDAGSLDPMKSGIGLQVEELGDRIRRLKPEDEDKKVLQSKAVDLTETLLQGRWIIFASSSPSVSIPFILILLFWLVITFMSFGLFAPKNSTVFVVFFVCALSVASAIFLVLELDAPFDGILKISPAPMQYALDHLDL